MELKAGDKVEAVNVGMSSGILKAGTIYTISHITNDDGVVLKELVGNWFYPSRFRLVETSTPEIGDTVEVTTKRGTVICGEVTAVGGSGGLNFDGGTVYVSEGDIKSVTIIEKAVKPKVWAVGDVVSADDYASVDFKAGTVVSSLPFNPDNSLILNSRGKWVDPSHLNEFRPRSVSTPRTIVFVP